MFTLVICLVVVVVSGAAVLHITLADPTQAATPRPRPRRAAPPVEVEPPAITRAPPMEAEPTAVTAAAPQLPTQAPFPPTRTACPRRRGRAAALLVLLLGGLGAGLALVVAASLVLAAVALRGALAG